MAEEKKTIKAENSQAAPKKAPAKKVDVETAKKAEASSAGAAAPAKKTATKATAANEGEAAVKKVAAKAASDSANAAPAVKAASAPKAATAEKKEKTAKTTQKKAALMIVNNRVVAQSKTPLYAAQHKKGTAPYAISKQEVKVTLVKSTIGSIQVHKKTVAALGLKKIGQSKTFKKSPALDGMLFRVRHLIKVEEVK